MSSKWNLETKALHRGERSQGPTESDRYQLSFSIDLDYIRQHRAATARSALLIDLMARVKRTLETRCI